MNQPSPSPTPRRPWWKPLVLGVCVLAVGLGGLIVVLPELGTPEYRSRRYFSDTPGNMDGIRTAQIAYHAAFDTFIEVPEWTPRPVEGLDADAHPWPEDTPFDTLGWSPDGAACRGTFRVTLTPDGSDFLLEGYVDRDGDGVPAYYTGSRSGLVRQMTPNDVH